MPATATREKPILFSAPMVRAILEGRKTQTRRIVKPQPDACVLSYYPVGLFAHAIECPETGIKYSYGFQDDQREWRSPWHPGDRLWVRECFCKLDSDHPNDKHWAYRADPYDEDCMRELGYKWKPSIHMPRKAARIFLRVTGVRVERLNEISQDDAKAEGVNGGCIS